MKKSNPDHSNDIARLNRILGQVEGIKKMIEDKRYCVDILTQTKAVGSAIKGLEASILERHLQHCVSSAIEAKNKNESQKKIEELLNLFTKRL